MNANADVLAHFDDGSPAVMGRRHGRGHAYAVGLDVGAFISQAQQGRLTGREYVNAYTPQVDVLLRWLKAIYREGEPAAVTLGTVPQGRPLSVVLSYDVDYTESVANALEYSAALSQRGVRGTFFVQTKYVRDWNDDRFFDEDHLGLLRRLQENGELASHSVAHSPVFASLPLVDGTERYQAYAPFVKSKNRDARRHRARRVAGQPVSADTGDVGTGRGLPAGAPSVPTGAAAGVSGVGLRLQLRHRGRARYEPLALPAQLQPRRPLACVRARVSDYAGR